MFQIVFIAGALSGGYVVHRAHVFANSKPINKLKRKANDAKEVLAEKFDVMKTALSKKIDQLSEENKNNDSK